MRVEKLHAKIHRARVTESNLEYDGSLTLGRNLLEASGIGVHERVQVVNVTNGERLETYVIEGGEGEVCLNGAAARLGEVGDEVIVISYGVYDAGERADPRVVFVDEDNMVVSVE